MLKRIKLHVGTIRGRKNVNMTGTAGPSGGYAAWLNNESPGDLDCASRQGWDRATRTWRSLAVEETEVEEALGRDDKGSDLALCASLYRSHRPPRLPLFS